MLCSITKLSTSSSRINSKISSGDFPANAISILSNSSVSLPTGAEVNAGGLSLHLLSAFLDFALLDLMLLDFDFLDACCDELCRGSPRFFASCLVNFN